ncbi:MAG: trypsin-like peptidase domain-containing protein [Verrucomicrobiae bacterium]|nr:trypsin-like peptidase domain-containing protein [Verrucomicrobiae bacterium]
MRFCEFLLFLTATSLAGATEVKKVSTPENAGGLPDPANEPIVQVVKKMIPVVVNLSTEKLVVRAFVDPLDDVFNQFFNGPAFNRKNPSTIKILGSGFLIDEEGYLLTNEKVVERAADLKVKVTTADGKTYDGKYIYGDADRDLALIKIVREEKAEKEKFSFFDLQQLSSNYLGQTVIALGNPLGDQSSIRSGILSGKGRAVGSISGLLQTEAIINPGNSGGPLVDIAGKLVGISSMKIGYTQNSLAENRSFAIPGDVVAGWAKNALAIARGEKKPAQPVSPQEVLKERFGLEVQDLTPDLAKNLGFTKIDGVLITNVQKESPAEKEGITKGMVLQGVGRYLTPAVHAIPQEITFIKPGNPISLVVAKPIKQGSVLVQQNVEVQLVAR